MRIYLALLLVITSAVQSQDVRLIAKSTYQRDITDITKEIFRRSDSLHLAYSAKRGIPNSINYQQYDTLLQIRTNYNGSESQYLNTNTYNDLNLLVSSINYTYTDGEILPSSRVRRVYNNNNEVSEIYIDAWQTSNNSWLPIEKIEYTQNKIDFVTTEIRYEFKNDVWQAVKKSVTTYDKNWKVLRNNTFTEQDGSWKLVGLYNYSYDSLTKSSFEIWQDDYSISKSTRYYDNIDRLKASVNYISSCVGSCYENTDSTAYLFFDDNDSVFIKTFSGRNTSSALFVRASAKKNNQLTGEQYDYSFDVDRLFQKVTPTQMHRITTYNDVNNKRLRNESFLYNGSFYSLYSSSISYFDINNNETRNETYVYDSTLKFIRLFSKTFYQRTDNVLHKVLGYQVVQDTLIENYRTSYYYEKIPLVVTKVDDVEKPYTSILYPNPVTSTASVMLPSEVQITDAQFYSVNGELYPCTFVQYGNMLQVDATMLPQGYYTVRCKINDTTVVTSFIKQ